MISIQPELTQSREFAMTHHKSNLHIQSFYAGVLSALAIIAIHDERTLFDEIVSTVGETELVKTARKDGAMRWSGLSQYDYGKKLHIKKRGQALTCV